MKAPKALMSVLLLLLLMGGVPALLLAWGDPLSLLSVKWSTALLRPDDGTILLGALSAVGWFTWAVLAATVMVELISHLTRHRIRLRLPGINWLQPTVGALVAMALTPMLTSQANEPAAPEETRPVHSVGETANPSAARKAVRSPTRDYVVRAGDELWGIAERELGDGAGWRNILRCNPGVTTDTPLIPGNVLHLPAAVAEAPLRAPPPPPRIVVERNDTLWDLADEHLDDPYRWPDLYEANRNIIADPDEIDVGWSLALPPPAVDVPPPTSAEAIVEDVASPAVKPEDPNFRSSLPVPAPDAAPRPPDQASARSASAVDAPPPPGPPSGPGSKAADPAATVTSVPTRSAVGSPTSEKVVTPGPVRRVPDSLSTPTDAVPVKPPADADASQPGDMNDPRNLLGPIGSVLAGSLVASVLVRRRFQLVHRAVGTRFGTLTPTLQRFFSALVHQSRTAPVNTPPMGAAAVVVGWNDTSDVVVDLEVERLTLIRGAAQDTAGMTAAILTSLLCADWSVGVDIVAVQGIDSWEVALDDPGLSEEDNIDAALARLQRLCAERRLALGHEELAEVRADADRASVYNPVVFMFCGALRPAHLDRIHDCLSLGHVGVSAVAVMDGRPDATQVLPTNSATLEIESETRARLTNGEPFQPQLLNQPARHAVSSLFAAAMDERTEPAPWWRAGDAVALPTSQHPTLEPTEDGAMTAWSTPPAHPTLMLLGPVELLGAKGVIPSRAVNQCVEYCAWLLAHPGSSPTAMVRELLVAETTRRSNMSRLRSWLGTDDSGSAYLPDAYSGRIRLAPSVTSDWERFQALLAGGVNRSSSPLLREALSLVRGEPLEGVAFRWPWTSQWAADMSAMITDAAIVLCDRCMTQQQNDGALWAIMQGQRAVPEDEALAVRRIQLSARMGDHDGVETAVTQLTRAFRTTNRDLSAESIQRIQHALHLALSRAPRR